jgi:EAL domain-containing protein (putative c-di-GMP-specific phosphodiesterase class I)
VPLDDLGTGFSSLSKLRHFPVLNLKIDREFITNVVNESQSRTIIWAIVETGQASICG